MKTRRGSVSEHRAQANTVLALIRSHPRSEADKKVAYDLLNELSPASVKEGKQLSEQIEQGRADAQTKLAALAPALDTAAADKSNPTQKDDADKLVSALPASVVHQTIAELPVATVQHISPRVYLHIANEAQREKAKAIQAVLIANKYISPGVQNVSGQGYIPDTLEVRYFDLDSKSKAKGSSR